MSEVFFNTHEVAKMLQVDKSTVKRWSDEGKLKCYRTPGGHRKFSVECLYRFMNEFNYGVATNHLLPFMSNDDAMLKQVITKNEFHILQSVVIDAALKIKKEEIIKVISESYQNGLSLALIFDNVIKPSVRNLKALFDSGRIPKYDLLLAARTLSTAITIATDTLPRETYKEQDIVCASLSDVNANANVEFTAITALLENLGYRVLNLGNHTIADGVSQIFEDKKISLVCLYCNHISNMEKMMNQISAVRSSLIGKNVFLLLTGEALIEKFQNFFAGISFTVCNSFAEIELINTNSKTIQKQIS